MRIIAGIAKGMPLAAPRAGIRPTADRIREAVFSSLGARVTGARVLDLFAGTGALGLEAASRGAASVVFVESDRAALDCLRRNLKTFQRGQEIACDFSLVRGDVFAQLRKLAGNFYLVFADPPYGDTAQLLLAEKTLPGLLIDDGLLVLESARRDKLAVPGTWRLLREAIYGDTRVSYLTAA
jgi:16S rRNA (guanine966-N2)-methyltransferase